MNEKPKTALDWIRWARKEKEKGDGAPPDDEAPAPAKPTHDDPPAADEPVATTIRPAPAWMEQDRPAKVAPAGVAEPVTQEQVPEEPPALPVNETFDEDDEDFDSFDDIDDVDDFDKLTADVPASEPRKDPAPAPAAAKPRKDPAPAPAAAKPQLPEASNSTVFIPENSVYTFAVSDFNFVEVSGRELAYVVIIALAGDGSLRFDHADVTMGQKIERADIEAGRFQFIPSKSHGSVSHDSFLYKVHDGQSGSRVAYTMTIEALPVED